MVVFSYDKTFEGLLSVLFEAYSRRVFPDRLTAEGEPLPLFYDQAVQVATDDGRSERVWKGLKKKLTAPALVMLSAVWHSELPEVDILLLRYMRKAIDSPASIELNFGDPDVLEMSKISKKVSHERLRVIQFARFQKASDDTYFAAMEPIYNVLPLAIDYFQDRFADQKWILYDLKRQYGFYYDMETTTEIRFEDKAAHLLTGKLDEELMAGDEKVFQKLWQTYFKSISIKERANPRLHRQNMPARFWKHLTEKQSGKS